MPPNVRLSDTVEEYLRLRRAKGYAATTIRNEGYVLRRFLAWYGDVQLRSMTPVKVADFFYGSTGVRNRHTTRDGRVREAVMASTHNYYRSRLNSLFRFATQRGYLRVDLLYEVDALREPSVLRQRPNPNILNQMIDNADSPRDRALIATLVHTALRRNESLALTVADVDLCENWLHVYITKSQVEDRLPITSNLARELRRWLHVYAADLGRPLLPEDYLFPYRKPGVFAYSNGGDGVKVKYRTADNWLPSRAMSHPERAVKAALARAGLPTENEGCHTLRRAAARAFFDELNAADGYDSSLRIVSAWLHHKNSTTTERYLGLDVERQRRDEMLRGREFLADTTARVIELRRRSRGG